MSFLYIKGLNIKHGSNSAKVYENPKVHTIQVKHDLWVSIKDVGNGLGFKNIYDLVLKKNI